MNEPFLSISDVSARLGVPAHTLRYWEKQFPVAVKPTTGSGGRRYYREEVVSALSKIKELLYTRGMTIMGVKKLLKDGGLNSVEFDESAEKTDTPARPVHRPAKISNSANDIAEIGRAIELLERARAELI